MSISGATVADILEASKKVILDMVSERLGKSLPEEQLKALFVISRLDAETVTWEIVSGLDAHQEVIPTDARLVLAALDAERKAQDDAEDTTDSEDGEDEGDEDDEAEE